MRIYISTTLVLFMLSACSASKPSESIISKELEAASPYSADIKDNVLRIASVTKTNGLASEIAGVKLYQLEYQATLEYIKAVPKAGGGWDCYDKRLANPTRILEGEDVCAGHNVGDKISTKGEMRFVLTEKGWKGPSGAIY